MELSGNAALPRTREDFRALLPLEAFALDPLALELARPAHCLGGFTGPALGRFLVMPSQLHLTEDAFALHLLFQRLERLIDIVVPNENLHLAAFSSR